MRIANGNMKNKMYFQYWFIIKKSLLYQLIWLIHYSHSNVFIIHNYMHTLELGSTLIVLNLCSELFLLSFLRLCTW